MKNERVSLLFPIALVFYEIATYLSNDMYLPSLPALTYDLNISQDLAQYTLLFWFLGSASMQLVVGPLSDRFGRKIVLLIGGLFYIVSTYLNAITDNIIFFLILRFIQGTTVCSVVVAGYAAVHELYDSKMAMKIITLMGSITILAPAFGPLLGAVILEVASWRTLFYLLSFLALIGVVMLSKVMPHTNPERIRLHVKEIIKDYFAITTRLSFLRFTVSFCLLFLSLICWIVESPFVIVNSYQKSTIEYGIIQFVVFAGFIIGAQITRSLLNRFYPLQIINAGMMVAFFAGIALIILSFFESSHLYWLVCFVTILALGSAMATGPLNRFAIEACHEPMGRRMAIFSTLMNLFGVLATILVTLFHDETMKNLSILIASGVVLAFIFFHAPFHKVKEQE